MPDLLIKDGTVYDPQNGIDGKVQDVWIDQAKIIPAPSDPNIRATKTIDARGCIVMSGGIDMHCHVAGPKLNLARKMLPESSRKSDKRRSTDILRSGTAGIIPSSYTLGYLYTGLGYTTVCDAAVAPLSARHAHEEFSDVPIVDKGFLALVGNHKYVLECIAQNNRERLEQFCHWMLHAVKAHGMKVANPGGIEAWKTNRSNANSLDDLMTPFNISPRMIVRELALCADRLGLPHPLHIHCNQLGMPGNHATTLETMKAIESSRAHFAHIQYHSYSGDQGDTLTFGSAVPALAEYVNNHPNISVDVGHIAFGQAAALTADTPAAYFLHKATGTRWASCDIEVETGCGVVPIEYRDQSLVHGAQWAVGLEWYLLVNDPWRIAMSTDFPNGGSFASYPQMIAMLMSKSCRDEQMKRLHPAVKKRSVLAKIKREYTLNEIAIITRAAPAKLLGLRDKGHLAPGADADITIYSRSSDVEAMFQFPRYVIKNGDVILDDGEIRRCRTGSTYWAGLESIARPKDVEKWIEANYSVHSDNFQISQPSSSIAVPCHPQ